MSSTKKKKKKSSYKEKMARRKGEKGRARNYQVPKIVLIKERREDQNPYYEPTVLRSFHAVAHPLADLRLADAQKLSIEKK